MAAVSFPTIPYRPFFQAAFIPIKVVYLLFLQVIGGLLLCLGAKEWGKSLIAKAEKIETGCMSLFFGLWAYGRRFLVYSENFDRSCRGSCYWIIDQHEAHPEMPLEEIAKTFEEGAPQAAIYMHKNQIGPQLEESLIWSETAIDSWPPMPSLDPGVYTFLIGYAKDANDPENKAHRIAFFKEERSLLFNPNIGLSEWEDSDWTPLLDRTAADIRTSQGGYFTLECHSYTKNSFSQVEH